MAWTEYISDDQSIKESQEGGCLWRTFLFVNWEDTQTIIEPQDYSNVYLATFETAQARLKLYSE